MSDFVRRWFHAVHSRASFADQLKFVAPGVGIETWAGVTLRLKDQIARHEHLTDESHEFHSLRVEALPDHRVHAIVDCAGSRRRRPAPRAETGSEPTAGRTGFSDVEGMGSMRCLPGSAQLESSDSVERC